MTRWYGPTREEVFGALFDILSGSTVFEGRVYRRWREFQDDRNQQVLVTPYLIQWEGVNETTEYKGERGLPPIRTWNAQLLVYGRIPGSEPGSLPNVPGSEVSGGEVLNPLIDNVEDMLAPDPLADGVQTLGDLVQDCRIEGEIVKAPGDQDPSGLCIAVIPVKILVQ